MTVQVKLLRLLQDREYERLGGTRTLVANVRFVTATHRNLEQMVRTGGFREDLYYRQQTNREVGRNVSITTEAMERIKRSDFRGNVRELQNFMERLVVLAES